MLLYVIIELIWCNMEILVKVDKLAISTGIEVTKEMAGGREQPWLISLSTMIGLETNLI